MISYFRQLDHTRVVHTVVVPRCCPTGLLRLRRQHRKHRFFPHLILLFHFAIELNQLFLQELHEFPVFLLDELLFRVQWTLLFLFFKHLELLLPQVR